MSDRRLIVACLGASSTAGKAQAFDWVGELAARSGNEGFHFVNLGRGGDLVGDVLARIPQVVTYRPDIVIVWIGGNDVLAALSRRFYRAARLLRKNVPRPPSPEAYGEALDAIASRLRVSTSARLAFCSLSPIGEALNPGVDFPFQMAVNRRVAEYSDIVASVARIHGAAYIPLREALTDAIRRRPGRAMGNFRLFPFYLDVIRTLVLGESVDRLARRHRWHFHSDGMHLNRAGGMIVADRVQEFLETCRLGGG